MKIPYPIGIRDFKIEDIDVIILTVLGCQLWALVGIGFHTSKIIWT